MTHYTNDEHLHCDEMTSEEPLDIEERVHAALKGLTRNKMGREAVKLSLAHTAAMLPSASCRATSELFRLVAEAETLVAEKDLDAARQEFQRAQFRLEAALSAVKRTQSDSLDIEDADLWDRAVCK